ncbi:MAG: nicotinate-nicotinamide nucleotide adenylyltransferase [archaeon]
MPNWKEAKYLLKNANFIVARRPNFSVKNLKKYDFFRPYIDNIYLINSILVDISSSLIRENLRKNKFIKYMTPDSVIRYIKKNKLYID